MVAMQAIRTIYAEHNSVTSMTFDDIPSSYEHLYIRGTLSCPGNGVSDLWMQFGDAGHSPVDTGSTNYSRQSIWSYAANTPTVYNNSGGTSKFSIGFTAATEGTNYPNTAQHYTAFWGEIYDYANPSKYTSVQGSIGMADRRAPYTWHGVMHHWQGTWFDTSVLNAIKIWAGNGDFWRGSEITLYGWNSS